MRVRNNSRQKETSPLYTYKVDSRRTSIVEMDINGRKSIKLPIRFHCEVLSQSWLIEYTVLDEAQNKTLNALQTLENPILSVSPKKIQINSRANNAPYDYRGETYSN